MSILMTKILQSLKAPPISTCWTDTPCAEAGTRRPEALTEAESLKTSSSDKLGPQHQRGLRQSTSERKWRHEGREFTLWTAGSGEKWSGEDRRREGAQRGAAGASGSQERVRRQPAPEVRVGWTDCENSSFTNAAEQGTCHNLRNHGGQVSRAWLGGLPQFESHLRLTSWVPLNPP